MVATDAVVVDLRSLTATDMVGATLEAAVSAAENFATMLVDANRVMVVGRTSAGTNGELMAAIAALLS